MSETELLIAKAKLKVDWLESRVERLKKLSGNGVVSLQAMEDSIYDLEVAKIDYQLARLKP